MEGEDEFPLNVSTNDELDKVGRLLKIPGYLPAVRKSQVKTFKVGDARVVNLDDDGVGTHWVSYFVPKENVIWYFDSFGLPPPKIIEKQKLNGYKIFYNSGEIQNGRSSSCGWYAIAFLDNVAGKKRIRDFIDAVYEYQPGPKIENEVKINKIKRTYKK